MTGTEDSGSAVVCKTVDEKLLDYLYEELTEVERRALEGHIVSCARCQAEVSAFGRVRSAARSVAMVEPPPAVSAKILFQAAQRKARGAGKVLPLLRKALHHPAYSMAAGFLLISGVAGYQILTRGGLAAPTFPIVASPKNEAAGGGGGAMAQAPAATPAPLEPRDDHAAMREGAMRLEPADRPAKAARASAGRAAPAAAPGDPAPSTVTGAASAGANASARANDRPARAYATERSSRPVAATPVKASAVGLDSVLSDVLLPLAILALVSTAVASGVLGFTRVLADLGVAIATGLVFSLLPGAAAAVFAPVARRRPLHAGRADFKTLLGRAPTPS